MGKKYIKEDEDGKEHVYERTIFGNDRDLGELSEKTSSSSKTTHNTFSRDSEVEGKEGVFGFPKDERRGNVEGQEGTFKRDFGGDGYTFHPDSEKSSSSPSSGSSSSSSGSRSYSSGGGGGSYSGSSGSSWSGLEKLMIGGIIIATIYTGLEEKFSGNNTTFRERKVKTIEDPINLDKGEDYPFFPLSGDPIENAWVHNHITSDKKTILYAKYNGGNIFRQIFNAVEKDTLAPGEFCLYNVQYDEGELEDLFFWVEAVDDDTNVLWERYIFQRVPK